MIKRLLSFLDASPVNFLAVKNIADTLLANGFRRVDPSQPLGEVKSGDRFFVTKTTLLYLLSASATSLSPTLAST